MTYTRQQLAEFLSARAKYEEQYIGGQHVKALDVSHYSINGGPPLDFAAAIEELYRLVGTNELTCEELRVRLDVARQALALIAANLAGTSGNRFAYLVDVARWGLNETTKPDPAAYGL